MKFYQGFVKMGEDDGACEVTSHDMERLDSYGATANCIARSFPSLKPYCFCRTNK